MDYFCAQVQQKDVGRRLQVGQELLEYLGDPARSPDVEQDQQRLDKVIDELAAWVNSSNFKVRRGAAGAAIAFRVPASDSFPRVPVPSVSVAFRRLCRTWEVASDLRSGPVMTHVGLSVRCWLRGGDRPCAGVTSGNVSSGGQTARSDRRCSSFAFAPGISLCCV